jgi:hypothetical protein
MPALTLKRASKHRSGGPWDDDDYDLTASGMSAALCFTRNRG